MPPRSTCSEANRVQPSSTHVHANRSRNGVTRSTSSHVRPQEHQAGAARGAWEKRGTRWKTRFAGFRRTVGRTWTKGTDEKMRTGTMRCSHEETDAIVHEERRKKTDRGRRKDACETNTWLTQTSELRPRILGVRRDAVRVRSRKKTSSSGTRRSLVRTRPRGKVECSPCASPSAISIRKNHHGCGSPPKCSIRTCTAMAHCAWTSSKTGGALATASPPY